MDITILLTQIVVMFLLMGIGAICYKRGMVNEVGSAQMSSLITTFVLPCIIINAFCREFDPDMFGKLLQAFLLSAILLALSTALAALLFRRGTPDYADKRMCVILCNNGFMALPLLQALFGEDGVFIGSINIVCTNIFLWTYGVFLLSRAARENGSTATQGMSIRKIFLNPGTIGLYIGLAIFLTSFELPTVISNAIGFMADLNTPLAMMILGIYLAQSDLKKIVRDRAVYFVVACRLLIVPLFSILLMLILPFDHSVSNVLIISVSTPCAVVASMFAQMYGTNYRYSSQIIAFSTLLSAVTMPLILVLYQLVIGA